MSARRLFDAKRIKVVASDMQLATTWWRRGESLRRNCCGYTPTYFATVHRKVAICLTANRTFRFPLQIEKQHRTKRHGVVFGGGGGNRTPVQKPIPVGISERRYLIKFPKQSLKYQGKNSGSLYFMTANKAIYRSHLPLSDARNGSRSFRADGGLIKPLEQLYCCWLIYKCRF